MPWTWSFVVVLRCSFWFDRSFAGFKFEAKKDVIDMLAAVQGEVRSIFERILLSIVIRRNKVVVVKL